MPQSQRAGIPPLGASPSNATKTLPKLNMILGGLLALQLHIFAEVDLACHGLMCSSPN